MAPKRKSLRLFSYLAGSNRQTATQYDGMGNKQESYATYNESGRLGFLSDAVTTDTMVLAYNGLGELARTVMYHPDPCSIEQLLLSRDDYLFTPDGRALAIHTANTASVNTDYVWVDGLPVAQFVDSYDSQEMLIGTTLTYLHPDHLGTPRLGTSQSKAITWRYRSDAFGIPDAQTSGVVRLRFPGQISLGVAGVHYNYYRDYEPEAGRYLESDPIGLDGGLNTYGYVEQNPLSLIDALGLAAACGDDQDCIDRCLKAYYGDWYDRAFDVSIFGLVSFGAREAVELGLNEVGENVEDRLSRQANRALYGGGASYEKGKRLLRTLKQFRAFNAATNVLAVGATSFVAGAQINCRFRCELQ